MSRYPFGLHGYHRPSGKSGKVEWNDPLNVFGSTYDPSRKQIMAAEEEELRKKQLRSRVDSMYGVDNPDSAKALEGENTQIADATRGYYTDALNRSSTRAERNTRFNLARQGLLGGSEDSSQQAEVSSDKNLGATRIDEAVRRAIAGLTSQRENERLSAIGLVNSGAGDSAVTAASEGIKNSFANANSQTKADIFGDLFVNSGDAAAAQANMNAQNAFLRRYQQQLATFFPQNAGGGSTGGGRVTPTS